MFAAHMGNLHLVWSWNTWVYRNKSKVAGHAKMKFQSRNMYCICILMWSQFAIVCMYNEEQVYITAINRLHATSWHDI